MRMRQPFGGFVADLLNWPRRATCWHSMSLVTVGNALTKAPDGNQRYNDYAFQSAAVNGDTFTNGFMLRPGTYTMSVLGITGPARGIIDWYIDDRLVVTGQDWYTVGATFNTEKTATVQVTGPSPWHVLKGVLNGKNASSTGYEMPLTVINFYASAD